MWFYASSSSATWILAPQPRSYFPLASVDWVWRDICVYQSIQGAISPLPGGTPPIFKLMLMSTWHIGNILNRHSGRQLPSSPKCARGEHKLENAASLFTPETRKHYQVVKNGGSKSRGGDRWKLTKKGSWMLPRKNLIHPISIFKTLAFLNFF